MNASGFSELANRPAFISKEINHPMQFTVEQEPAILAEYRDDCEECHDEIENLAIHLEQHPDDLDTVTRLRNILDDLSTSSSKLSLAPIIENIELIVQAFDFMLEHQRYPTAFSDYLLLLLDRLLVIVRDVQHAGCIDMFKTQNIHVSLQDIVLSKTMEQLEQNIPVAIEHLTRESPLGQVELNETFDVELFGDDDDDAITLFDEPETPQPASPEIFISSGQDPIRESREFMASKTSDPLCYLADISDIHTDHGTHHTRFLQEIALAMNSMAGAPLAAEDLWAGICLHDIGLAHISDILNQKRKLTDEEFAQIRQHPVKGADLASRCGLSEDARLVILHHHEGIDGRGYPSGLQDGAISEGGKILAIVDAYHAMVTNRPHKRHTKNVLRAVSEINACSGTQFDPHWVRVFNECIKKYWLPMHENSCE